MRNLVSAESILERVVAQTRLSDFGDTALVPEFLHAIAAINAEVSLSEAGKAILEESFERLLTNRLRLEHDFHEHPEIAAEPLAPPVVITGFPRTGTTKLQRMLSANPKAQGLWLWKLLNPAPLPIIDRTAEDARIGFARRVEEMTKQAFPEMWAAHPTPACEPEEDLHFHEITFVGGFLPMRVGARRLLAELTPAPVKMYEYLRRCLQYLQWQDPTARGGQRPWILKSPIHIGNIATILQVFPGAKIVHCHRDVEISMASTCRLIEISRTMYASVPVDRAALGREIVAYWSNEWERNLTQRATLDPGSTMDVSFEEMERDALGVVERIAAFTGQPFDDAARSATRRWLESNPRHAHGKHVYQASDYALNRRDLVNAFRVYLNRFPN